MFNPDSAKDVGARIQSHRKRYGLSLRALAREAEVSAAMISYAERGVCSLSLTTLQKVLAALGTTLGEFFASPEAGGEGPVFLREQMQAISDPERTYTILLGKRPGVQCEMFDEHIRPSRHKPEFEQLNCDVGGYVLSGNLALEVKGEARRTLRPGDAFYVTKGTTHRGFALGGKEARLITVYYPASY